MLFRSQFEAILSRMLATQPGDRYANVAALTGDLNPLLMAVGLGAAGTTGAATLPPPPAVPAPSSTQMQTVAVGRSYDSTTIAASPEPDGDDDRYAPVSSPPASLQNSPIIIGALGILLAIIAGWSSWKIFSSVAELFPAPAPTPVATVPPTPAPPATRDEGPPPTYRPRLNLSRSEERRVGEECRSRWAPDP